MQPNFPGNEIDVLVEFGFEINNPVVTEIVQPLSRHRIQSDEAITRSHVEDFSVAAIVEIGQPAPGKSAWCCRPSLAFIVAMKPQ